MFGGDAGGQFAQHAHRERAVGVVVEGRERPVLGVCFRAGSAEKAAVAAASIRRHDEIAGAQGMVHQTGLDGHVGQGGGVGIGRCGHGPISYVPRVIDTVVAPRSCREKIGTPATMDAVRPMDPPPARRLAAALAGLPGSVPGRLDRLHALGFAAVQLDAAAAGMRPRELGPTARRDLLARLRRRSLRPVGLDLWIPAMHLREPSTVDRASDAMHATIALAADLGRLDVSVQFGRPAAANAGGSAAGSSPGTTPPAGTRTAAPGGIVSIESLIISPDGGAGPPDSADASDASRPAPGAEQSPVVDGIRDAAEHHGVRLVDYTVGAASINGSGIGIDPVAWLSAGRSPIEGVLAAGPALAAVRVADLDASGMRVPPGTADGHLDFAEFVAVLDHGPEVATVVDPRQWVDPWGGLERAAEAWRACGR